MSLSSTMYELNSACDLGDGLILRRATAADAEALAEFNAQVHRNPQTSDPDIYVGWWVRDLLLRPHPTFVPEDFVIIEERETGRIVSSLNLISQTWSYEGIPFGVGRPELVGTVPEYRRRGLVRIQFEVIHAWSAARGEMVQAITGIPYFYRQFGYDMAMTLGGARLGYPAAVPKLKAGESEPYRVRPAAAHDLPFIAALYEQASQRYPIVCPRDEAMWRYELEGRSPLSCEQRELCIIEDAAGDAVGYLMHGPRVWESSLGVGAYELKAGVSWLAVTPSVLRYLKQVGDAYVARDHLCDFETIAFWLGAEHPAYQAAGERLPIVRRPYAWYLRVADVPRFLRHVAPVLERRLAGSILAGHTGELLLDFYRGGARLVFDRGRLVQVEPWQASHERQGSAGFPGHTFLQMLFGHRTREELGYAFADCWVENEGVQLLLNILFPKRPSNVWPIS